MVKDGKDFECYFWRMDNWDSSEKFKTHTRSTWNGLVQVSFEELTGNGVEGDLLVFDGYTRKLASKIN